MTPPPALLLASAAGDTATLVLLTMLGAVPVVVAGAWLTRRRSGASARTQALVVALAPLMATWVGALLAARSMFISAHDLGALGVIALTAGAVGVLAAWSLARRIRRDADRLGDLSRSIAEGAGVEAPAASVTELGGVGAQLAAMSRQLEESHGRELALERSRRELVAWVSHDLRSPLAAIRAMAEAIEDGVVDDPVEVQGYLRSIGTETDRLAGLVDDLFELSRISSGAIDLRPEVVAATDLIDSVTDAVRPMARSREVVLARSTTDEPMILVSLAEAERVLRNLVDNAVRHTPGGGTVTVGARTTGAGVELTVMDECGGIPTTDLARVFDVAFRGDAARTRDDGGGGLGLAIAKGLVEAQRGSIAVSNHVGGCCFTVCFPRADLA